MIPTVPARDWLQAASGRLSASLCDLPPLAALESTWRDLERRANASFFLSWPWMGTWLQWLPADLPAQLLQVECGGTVIGLAVLTRRVLHRHHLLRSRALFLNSSGDAALDEISIEHNGVLAESGGEVAVTRAGVRHLIERERRWDEIFVDGMGNPAILEGAGFEGATVQVQRSGPSRWVDLAALRRSGMRFADTLGRNTRYQVRRSTRELERPGPLVLEEATDAAQARAFLERLRELHQDYWRARGRPGSFARPDFGAFHERLIEREFGAGVVQLLRLTAGGTELGYLYNYVYRGRVYSYQSGFRYAEGNSHYRPGLVAHALAIEHNAARGLDAYDFLAGDSEFKRRLASREEPLGWIVIQRPRLKLRLEAATRRALHSIDRAA